MKPHVVTTQFAPAERSDMEVIARQARAVEQQLVLHSILESLPYFALVVNSNREVVYCNRNISELIGDGDVSEILGRRPGDLLSCVHAGETCGGCGTTQSCSVCGLVDTVLSGQRGSPTSKECRINRRLNGKSESLDILVSAAPVMIEGEQFVLATVIDISHEKRRRVLERIFFHDVLNIASGLQNLTTLLVKTAPGGELAEYASRIMSASRQLVSEITSQRQLLAAENNELSVNPIKFGALQLLHDLIEQYRDHPSALSRIIKLDESVEDIYMTSDTSLLMRVLGNMLINALEASGPGESVTLGCSENGDKVEFWANNTAIMPIETQLQVFQRSFSTKGPGRGLGTYSMKLLSERYLGGSVGFETIEGKGTTFYARYPKELSL